MAITFDVDKSYPKEGFDNVPIGEDIKLRFSVPPDLKSIKESVILYGPDQDRTMIGDGTYLKRGTDLANYLRSPNQKGFIDFDVKIEIEGAPSHLVRPGADVPATAILTPKTVLTPNTEYNLYVFGVDIEEPDTGLDLKNKAISRRTTYEPAKGGAAHPGLKILGTFKGAEDDTLNIEITELIAGHNPKYKWWFASEGASSGRQIGNRAVQRWRSLDKGLMIRFYEFDYAVNDLITVKCYPEELLAASAHITFNTSSNEVTVPTVKSSSDIGISELIPSVEDDVITEVFRVLEMSPADKSINNATSTEKIVITFNKNIDSTTVTKDTLKVYKQPVTGVYGSTADTVEIRKLVSVAGKQITVEI